MLIQPPRPADQADAAIETPASESTAEVRPQEGPVSPPLVEGSVLARTLYALFEGDPRILVKSPPGAGKSRLVANVCHWLLANTDLSICVLAFTNDAVRDLACRLAEGWDESRRPWVLYTPKQGFPQPEGTSSSLIHAHERTVAVRTVASATLTVPKVDVLIVDEAYQTQFSDFRLAASSAGQVIMVGDPGQIGPVVKTDPYMLMHHHKGKPTGPSAPAPSAYEVLSGQGELTVLNFEHTYRLGAETAEVIAPLYDFPFTSRRPDRVLVDAHGVVRPELRAVSLPAPARSITDEPLMAAVAGQVRSLTGSVVIETGADGSESEHRVRERDVAVVVAHRDQKELVAARLAAEGFPNVTVGTANTLQGGQWHAVVAIDPSAGGGSTSPHILDPGRLCVMASRHLTTLTWLHDGTAERLLSDFASDPETDPVHARWAELGIEVRRSIYAAGVGGVEEGGQR